MTDEQKLKLPQFETDQFDETGDAPEAVPAQKGRYEHERGCTRTSTSRNSSISSCFWETDLKETFLFQETSLCNKIISSWNISRGLFYFFI